MRPFQRFLRRTFRRVGDVHLFSLKVKHEWILRLADEASGAGHSPLTLRNPPTLGVDDPWLRSPTPEVEREADGASERYAVVEAVPWTPPGEPDGEGIHWGAVRIPEVAEFEERVPGGGADAGGRSVMIPWSWWESGTDRKGLWIRAKDGTQVHEVMKGVKIYAPDTRIEPAEDGYWVHEEGRDNRGEWVRTGWIFPDLVAMAKRPDKGKRKETTADANETARRRAEGEGMCVRCTQDGGGTVAAPALG